MWAVMCVCRHVCHTQAQSCLSTGWALNRCFAWVSGTAAVLAQGGGGGGGVRGGPKIALRGGDGMGARQRRGGGFQKWASVPGPLFCVRTVVATKGAGTQILTRKIFFHSKNFPHFCVVKMISATWGSF